MLCVVLRVDQSGQRANPAKATGGVGKVPPVTLYLVFNLARAWSAGVQKLPALTTLVVLNPIRFLWRHYLQPLHGHALHRRGHQDRS